MPVTITVEYGPIELAQFTAELYRQGLVFQLYHINGAVYRVELTGF